MSEGDDPTHANAPLVYRGDLTQGPILGTLMAFSLPLLATNVLLEPVLRKQLDRNFEELLLLGASGLVVFHLVGPVMRSRCFCGRTIDLHYLRAR